MKSIVIYALLILTTLISCKRDTAIPNRTNTVCGTVGWPQVNCKVKFVVTGTSIPDSANFNINSGQARFGTVYNRTFINPTLILMDSTNFCGDKNSDILLNVYNHDTTKIYTTKIYVNDSLQIQLTGYRHIFTVGQCK